MKMFSFNGFKCFWEITWAFWHLLELFRFLQVQTSINHVLYFLVACVFACVCVLGGGGCTSRSQFFYYEFRLYLKLLSVPKAIPLLPVTGPILSYTQVSEKEEAISCERIPGAFFQ